MVCDDCGLFYENDGTFTRVYPSDRHDQGGHYCDYYDQNGHFKYSTRPHFKNFPMTNLDLTEMLTAGLGTVSQETHQEIDRLAKEAISLRYTQAELVKMVREGLKQKGIL